MGIFQKNFFFISKYIFQENYRLVMYYIDIKDALYFIVICEVVLEILGAFLSVAWPTGVQLLVFFCSSVPVVLFDIPGISRCRSQHVSVESSSLLHHSIYL